MKRLEFNPTTITIVTIVALCIAAVIFVISYFTYKKRSANFKQVSSNVVETYTEAFPEAY
jgi:L-asparagine transporter-like permease